MQTEQDTAPLLELIDELAGDGFAGGLGSLFEFMEYAEEAIERAGPEADRAFTWIRPHEVLLEQNLDRGLWSHHCDELVGRFLACRTMPHGAIRSRMAPATDAELLVMLNVVSTARPLVHELAEILSHLFREIFPDAPLLREEHYPFPEEPSPYVAERILELKHEHRVAIRAEIKKKEVPHGTQQQAPQQAQLELG